MRINLALLGAFGLSILSSGCIYTDRSEEYQRSISIPSVVLPSEVTSTPLQPLYPIPEVTPRLDAFLETDVGGDGVPRPEPMSAEREAAKVKIQKVSERQWLLIEAPASQVWPLAQSYLSSAGIQVAKSDAASGLIQTDWVHFKTDPNTKSHFQIRIEKGVRADSTEVHILQQQRPVNSTTQQPWPLKSDDPERESILLESLANSLAQGIGNKAASLLGQSVGGESKAELVLENGEPAIVLRIDKTRAWASLAVGLKKEGFIRWEESDNLGVFFIQYTGDYRRPNWFVRLFTWGNRAPVTDAPFSLDAALQHLSKAPEVIDLMSKRPQVAYNASLANTPLGEGAGYLLFVTKAADRFVVKARNYNGERLDLPLNKKLLATLRRNLI